MPNNATLPLGERLRKIAADDRRLAENANEYFHRHQDRAGWYNAVIKGEYEDRSDYAPTLERCALLEEAAKALDAIQQSEDAPQNADERAELCRCGHSRGNHRWFGIGGKHPCYVYDKEVRCACERFVPATVQSQDATECQHCGEFEPFYLHHRPDKAGSAGSPYHAFEPKATEQAECRKHHCNSCREDEGRCCPCGSCTFYEAQQAEARVHTYDPAYDAVFPYPNFVCKTHDIANRESGMGEHINDPKCHVVIEWPKWVDKNA